MNLSKRVIMISGAPGSGKTTLAKPLAEKLNFALISKDVIKETLFDKLGEDPFDLVENRRLGGAAMEVMWSLAVYSPKVILEANFRPESAYEKNRIKALPGQLVEVYCRCSAEEVKRRFAVRTQRKDHHPVHSFKEIPPEMLAQYTGPVGIGRVIEVDTEKPVNTDELAGKIDRLWRDR